jgi:hypothetical protein
LTIPFTHVLANAFSRAGISNLERQTAAAQETSRQAKKTTPRRRQFHRQLKHFTLPFSIGLNSETSGGGEKSKELVDNVHLGEGVMKPA